jgi:hypothetical protein
VREQFALAMCRGYRAAIKDYELVGYIAKHGKEHW